MKLFFGVESPYSATTRYRVSLPARELARHGHTVHIGTTINVADIADYERIILHRSSAGDILRVIELARKHGIPVGYDIDDDILNIEPSNPVFQVYLGRPEVPWNQLMAIRFASGIIVSTERLKQVYGIMNPKARVVENYVDAVSWLNNPLKMQIGDSENVRLVWAGSNTHAESLALLEKPLMEVMKRHPQAILVLVGLTENPFRKVQSSRIVSIGWSSYTTYQSILKSCDIGLAPLANNLFNLGKSDLRIKELASARLPIVGSPTGEYSRSIRDAGGILCESTEEWIEELTLLIRDRELRHNLGEKAFQWVIENWDIRRAEGWKKFLDAWENFDVC